MYARVTTFHLQPGTADEFKQYGQDVVLPRIKQVPGFQRAIVLQNDAAGKAIVITLLETEDQRDALETTGFFHEYHAATEHLFTAPPVTEQYELVSQNTHGEQLPIHALFAFIRVHPGMMDEALDFSHNARSQATTQAPGFVDAWILANLQKNKLIPLYFWETETARPEPETSDDLKKTVAQSSHMHAPLTMEVATVTIQS